jgi:GntR family transcriptional regulator
MKVDKNLGIPLYVQLGDVLRQQIRSGELPVNTKLPSERELCERYDVSRITVRKTISELLSEDLIYTAPGKGSYVAPPSLDDQWRPFNSFTEDMLQRGQTATSRILDAQILHADDAQAKQFNLPRGAELVMIRRLRSTKEDKRPIVLQESWLPHHRCPGLLDFDLKNRSLFDILRTEYRIRLARAATVISAALGEENICHLLGLTPPAAVLINLQTTYNEHDEIIEYSRSTYRGDRYTLQIDMRC